MLKWWEAVAFQLARALLATHKLERGGSVQDGEGGGGGGGEGGEGVEDGGRRRLYVDVL